MTERPVAPGELRLYDEVRPALPNDLYRLRSSTTLSRPDLAVEKREGARGIFHSLHEQLLSLPAETEIWPGHLGGSLCGGPGMDMKVSSTIGFERRHNDVLAIDDETAFVDQVTAGLPPQPPNFERVVALNRGPLVTTGPQLLPLAPLCRPDCPGLCAECGALLAQAGSEHGHERAIDPRWAGLRQRMTQAEPAGRPAPEIREESGRGRP